ncbi:hypothetical protein [Sulfuritalea hydrogenivorans]|jgi:hypothetical protein|uniref:Secreted protein n=1 Tax=Sulfuritalea hydrogenivorans sk43H TaxID=1223802 RepID=W0SL59_9PROT|nr:hypothetical protein [Sulfuritalea hydrogenivorans]BAO31350.1 hypothetical protein SUTH_03580 [Sulfuritalea hydrogenivorans sk43H]
MKRVAAPFLFLVTGALVLSTDALAAEEARRVEPGGAFLLAEIVVPAQPDSGQKARKSAAEARVKAKAYQESESGSPAIVVIPEEEEGLLGPRRQPESGASQNRAKARLYQQGQTPAQVPVPTIPGTGTSTADRAQDNRAKARSYVATDNTVVIERIGADGIPIVSCGKLVSNVAGHIGDDMQPGSVFFIMRDNKPFKVRCAQQ